MMAASILCDRIIATDTVLSHVDNQNMYRTDMRLERKKDAYPGGKTADAALVLLLFSHGRDSEREKGENGIILQTEWCVQTHTRA